ncbi:MAG: hypothetical protein KKE17_00805, partial [Proteobacteria bacterium]|nr:hypothetical protein [Pseudomonadota bacterium]MBU1708520.1 hypothetical protein [Pseudomonadota bacterium]
MKLPISKNTVLTSAQGVISFVAGVLLLLTPESVLAGNYLNSAHGSNSTGVSRATMATANYAKGNCAHCHEQHRSVGGTSSTPELFLGFDNEEDLCQGCHASTGTVGTATDAIKTDATKTYGHHLTTASGVHQAHETLSSL